MAQCDNDVMLLPAYAACLHCIGLAHMSFNYLLQHQMHHSDLLVACSSTALFTCSISHVHVLFIHFLIALCDCSM